MYKSALLSVLVLTGLVCGLSAAGLSGCDKKKQLTPVAKVTLQADDLIGQWDLAPGGEYNMANNFIRQFINKLKRVRIDERSVPDAIEQLAAELKKKPCIHVFNEDRTVKVTLGGEEYVLGWRIDGSRVHIIDEDEEIIMDYSDRTLTADTTPKGFKAYQLFKK